MTWGRWTGRPTYGAVCDGIRAKGIAPQVGVFERTYPESSIVTLSAPLTHRGWQFVGWWLSPIGMDDWNAPLILSPVIHVEVDWNYRLFEPIYRRAVERSGPGRRAR